MGLLALCIRWTKAFHTPARFYKRRHLFDVVPMEVEVELSLLTNHEVSLSDSAPNGPVGRVVIGCHPGRIDLSNLDRPGTYEFDRALTRQGPYIHKSPAASENPPDFVQGMDHALVW